MGLGALILALSHWDRLYMYGDDVNKLSPGRSWPLPDYGNYIGARIVDNYFIGYGFEVFRMLCGPLFGWRHLVDVHSAYSTVCYALSGIALVGALFAMARCFVPLGTRHFPAFFLAAQVLALQPTKMMAITGIGSFQVPLALSLWLLYPVLRFAVSGTDVLSAWRGASATVAAGAAAYLVAFSVTSVALFTLCIVAASAFWCLVRSRSESRVRFSAWPVWFRALVLLLPAAVAVALFFDVTSGRFADEQRQEFRVPGFGGVSWLSGLTHLPLRHGIAVDAASVLGLVTVAVLALRTWRSDTRARREQWIALAAILAPTAVAYSLFLLRISNLGGKDYFAHPGISAYFPFAMTVGVTGGLFALARSQRAVPALMGTAALALLAVHGGRQLAEVSTRELTKAEVKGIFDSLYTCHAYGESRVPVLLRNVELGWPHGADEEGWYLDAHRRAFREHVVGYGSYVDPNWMPVFYRVRSVDELHAELNRIRRARPLLELEARTSPYFIHPLRNEDPRTH